jgi:plasmid stabilization system protein ParE
MRVEFAAAAAQEVEDARIWYEDQAAGLGETLLAELRLATHLIAKHPTAWPLQQQPIRKFIVNRFPYKVLYVVEPEGILVLAFAHQHRRPDYWADRWPPAR